MTRAKRMAEYLKPTRRRWILPPSPARPAYAHCLRRGRPDWASIGYICSNPFNAAGNPFQVASYVASSGVCT